MFTDDEVKEAIQNALGNIPEPIQVVFRTSKCLDCSQRGDERLLSKYCHMKPTHIHTGISEDCHPGHIEPYHSEFHIEYKHPGRLLKLPGAFGGNRFTCCYQKDIHKNKGCVGT